jgi:hypothetical protein
MPPLNPVPSGNDLAFIISYNLFIMVETLLSLNGLTQLEMGKVPKYPCTCVEDLLDIIILSTQTTFSANLWNALKGLYWLPLTGVNAYNDTILNRVHGKQQTYTAADSLKEISAVGLASSDSVLDFITRQRPLGLPPHSLFIKINGYTGHTTSHWIEDW